MAAPQEREERYFRLCNSSNDGVFIYPLNNGKPGKFTEVNGIACSRLGYSRDELLRLSPVDFHAEVIEEVRGVALDSLAETGHSCSIEALESFMSQSGQFDIVVTNMTMPGMTGIELARKMLLIRPELPIVLCTGYSNLAREGISKGYRHKGSRIKATDHVIDRPSDQENP